MTPGLLIRALPNEQSQQVMTPPSPGWPYGEPSSRARSSGRAVPGMSLQTLEMARLVERNAQSRRLRAMP